MRTLVALFLVSLLPLVCIELVQATTYRSALCSVERDREMDKCAAQLGFLGNKSFKVPKNMTQMNQFCSELKDSLGCIQKYSRECLTSLSRQVLTTIIRNGKKTQSSLCKTDKSKREFMQKMACLTDDKIDQFHRCMDGSVARFEHIASKNVKQDDRIVSICCSGQIFQKELQNTVTRICKDETLTTNSKAAAATLNQSINNNRLLFAEQSAPDRRNSDNSSISSISGISGTSGSTATYLHEIVSSTMGSFTNLVCDGYQSYRECEKSPRMTQLLPKLEDITSQVRQNKLQPKAKSLISVLLVILTDQKPVNEGGASKDD